MTMFLHETGGDGESFRRRTRLGTWEMKRERNWRQHGDNKTHLGWTGQENDSSIDFPFSAALLSSSGGCLQNTIFTAHLNILWKSAKSKKRILPLALRNSNSISKSSWILIKVVGSVSQFSELLGTSSSSLKIDNKIIHMIHETWNSIVSFQQIVNPTRSQSFQHSNPQIYLRHIKQPFGPHRKTLSYLTNPSVAHKLLHDFVKREKSIPGMCAWRWRTCWRSKSAGRPASRV